MLRSLSVLLLIALLAGFAVLPLTAQTTTPDPNNEVVVVGPVDLGQGVIMVNNYIIAPASAFQPSILHQGDIIVVIGYLLPDGVTIQATSLEFFDGSPTPTSTATFTPTPIWSPTFTPTGTLTATPTATASFTPTMTQTPATPTPTDTGCNRPNHPVAQRLADAFGVSYDEIIGWHCAGFGFGEIARAYLLADATGATAASYFDQRRRGLGWGEIVKQTGVHPSDLAPGQVIRRGGNNDDDGDDQNDNHPGNGNSNGRGNGNNGNNGNVNNGMGNK